jgi:hypothetical protein
MDPDFVQTTAYSLDTDVSSLTMADTAITPFASPFPQPIITRIALILRKDQDTHTLATLMRCSSEMYEVAGLKLYEHIKVPGCAISGVLYGEGGEFGSSSHDEVCTYLNRVVNTRYPDTLISLTRECFRLKTSRNLS